MCMFFHRCVLLTICVSIASCLPICRSIAAAWDPTSVDYTGHKGKSLYVSKLGDNSDGSSWQKAFHTIQAALLAVPDDRGGHRIIVRPDTYVEGNLAPSHKGAAGSYNVLVGDCDGSLGSGGSGQIVIDSSDPGKGLDTRERCGTIRTAGHETPSPRGLSSQGAAAWDRWIVRRIYAAGGDTGLFWNLAREPEAFTVVVEDCIGIGRMFGGGVADHVSRADEPIVFRRCKLYCLDWRGEAGETYLTGAACIHGTNSSRPKHPDAVLEDCLLVSPDNALQSGYPYVDTTYTRVRLKNCRLIVLNFGQSQLPPVCTSTGIVRCDADDGRQLHVDFEDCRLMGFKVFGARAGEISYNVKGKVQAYLQFGQATPKGFQRLGLWPTELVAEISPLGRRGNTPTYRATPPGHVPTELPFDPLSPNYAGRRGKVLYVSKLGDNSDGSTWTKAFHTIGVALAAVPDDKGGHCVVVRPDTYLEIGWVPAHKGAAGAYNALVGDVDGRLGSGAKGWVVVDNSDPQRGFKSVDYSPMFGEWTHYTDLCLSGVYQTVLADKNLPDQERKYAEAILADIRQHPKSDRPTDTLDRWIFRHLYAVGSNGEFVWNQERENKRGPCSGVVDNCVGIGQGGAAGAWFVGRPQEPLLFRECYFICPDWFGDCGAVYVRADNNLMTSYPDAVFEDCTLVGADNALQTYSPGCGGYTRIRMKDCRLISLNFSPPRRTALRLNGITCEPSGIVCCAAANAEQLHIDFEDCRLMGCKVFGTQSGEVSYAIKGKVEAYVERQQPPPRGFDRASLWPVQLFENIAPPPCVDR